MGWLKRFLHRFNRRNPTAHPWISPKFLVLYGAVGVLVLSLAVWTSHSGPDGAGPASLGGSGNGSGHQGTLQSDYVGFPTLEEALARVEADPACAVDCAVDKEWQRWLEAHPGVEILDRTPVADPGSGVTLGFTVTYREATP